MNLLNRGLALAVVGAGLAALPTMGVQAAPAAKADTNGVAAMVEQASSDVAVSKEESTNKVGFIRVKGKGDLLPDVEGDSLSAAKAKANAYLDQYAANFGARPDELVRKSVDATSAGWTITYTQSYKGVEVFGSMLRAQVDREGDLTAVNGYAAPDLNLSVDPRITAADAGKRAVGTVREDPPAHDGETADLTGIKPTTTDLVVYRMGATRGETGKAVLAYEVNVSNEANVADVVFIDAQTGKTLNRWSTVHGALSRELYEASGTATNPTLTQVWKEGDAFPGTLNEDQQNLVNSGSESYWLYANAFGRDSYDGEGAIMRTVNNDPRINCPNANWNGVTTNYCNGVTSDDVVSHEWGHAYTQYTSGLIYQYQAGALNESFSDVWGETVDQINGREDQGEEFATKRAVGDCDSTAPPALQMSITAPASVAGTCEAVAATGALAIDTTPVTADVVVATDAADPAGPTTTDGCSAISNASAVAGKWAYVDRGTCTFAAKVSNVKAAGAAGIVIGNNNVDPPAGFTGDASMYGVMVSQGDGNRFKTAGTASITVSAEDVSTRPTTTRWLMGEKSTAFGGAIRDMWTPTCYGDPGKVTDAEYKCDPTNADAGGVHSNSGVPNHAYALVVDGGTYNGQTIAGLGLDKAAAIWWRAQSSYLTPTSSFTDAANAFEQSCADLVGQPINTLTTAANATPVAATPIAAGDCASVQAAMTAVEMRTEPVKCNFKALLNKDAPATCGAGFTEQVLWSEDFEDGLDGWTPSSEIVYSGGINAPWTSVANAPAGAGAAHASKVAYGPAPVRGECSNGQGDFSSRDSITSPQIKLPNVLRAPQITFEHYVATETGYDGGNLKMSVNGGDFAPVPTDAYTFNAPGTLTGAATNTSPLAGQPGFSGVDGGQLKGSWGQSQISLLKAGIKAGDTVQLRFDIGRDGCGGNDGWYIDNVKLIDCKITTTITAAHRPEPSAYGNTSTAEITVARADAGVAPTGTVTVTDANGKVLGTGTLAGGLASVSLPADIPLGTNALTATYQGSGEFATSTVNFTARVVGSTKRPSKTRGKLKPAKPEFRKDFKVIAKVRSEGARARGTVKVFVDGKRIAKVQLKKGRAVVKVTKDLKVGKHTLVVRYLGTKNVARSKAQVQFRVVR